MRPLKLLMAGAVAAAMPGLALPAATTGTFQVTATVSSSCSVTASTPAPGTYDPLAATAATAATGPSGVSVACSLLTPYTLSLEGGSTRSNISAGQSAADGADAETVTISLIF